MNNHKTAMANLPRPRMQPAPPETIHWPFVEPQERDPIEGSGHLHWTITAYMEFDREKGFMDSVMVEVEAPDERRAIARAMAVIERAHYRVSAVRESCPLVLAREGRA